MPTTLQSPDTGLRLLHSPEYQLAFTSEVSTVQRSESREPEKLIHLPTVGVSITFPAFSASLKGLPPGNLSLVTS